MATPPPSCLAVFEEKVTEERRRGEEEEEGRGDANVTSRSVAWRPPPDQAELLWKTEEKIDRPESGGGVVVVGGGKREHAAGR